jgi:hypothetical protein
MAVGLAIHDHTDRGAGLVTLSFISTTCLMPSRGRAGPSRERRMESWANDLGALHDSQA